MRKTIRSISTVVFVALDVAGLWGFIASSLWPVIELIGYTYISSGLLRAFYVWLMVFATGSALLLNWPWITRWWTAARRAQEAARLKEIRTFPGLAEELRHARAKIRNHLASGMRHVSVDSEVSSMWVKLKSLGINCPPSPFATDTDTEKAHRRWGVFLKQYCADGRIRTP